MSFQLVWIHCHIGSKVNPTVLSVANVHVQAVHTRHLICNMDSFNVNFFFMFSVRKFVLCPSIPLCYDMSAVLGDRSTPIPGSGASFTVLGLMSLLRSYPYTVNVLRLALMCKICESLKAMQAFKGFSQMQ